MVCKKQEQCKLGKMCGWAKDEETLLTECVEFIERVPLTNEEWFDGLSTREKAEFISELRHGMSERVMEIEEIFNDEDLDYEEAVEKWLKAVHKK